MSKCWFSRRVRPQNAGSSQSAQRFWPSIGTFAPGWWTQHPLQGPILAASTKVRKTTLSHGTQRGWQTRRLVYHNIQYGSETKSIMTKAINELAQGITGRHERCRWLADTFCQNYLYLYYSWYGHYTFVGHSREGVRVWSAPPHLPRKFG